jgi:hypothetical protein
MSYWDSKKQREAEQTAVRAWQKHGKTYRAKTLDALKALYGSGIHATLEGQPSTDWEKSVDGEAVMSCDGTIKPGHEPKGILTKREVNHAAGSLQKKATDE